MEIISELNKLADEKKAKILQRFFKTGKGEYGEGDIFLGITVPKIRNLVKQCNNVSLDEISVLMESPIHEARLLGLLILVKNFKLAEKIKDQVKKEEIFDFYLDFANQNKINNWDLVDLSAPNIVGAYLLDKDRSILDSLVMSDNLWERRIAVLSTFTFIRAGDFEVSLRFSEILLKDRHDLIHKAVGWMLREIGKRNLSVLRKFLDENYQKMPRTMLRYAIEKLDEKERKKYLRG